MNNDPREDEKMKKYFAVTVLMMVCFGISACNVNVNVKADPEKEENIDLETDIDEPISGTYDEDGYEIEGDYNSEGWRSQYKDIVTKWEEEHKGEAELGYNLIWIDEDDDPELLLYCDDDAWFAMDMYTMVDGKAKKMKIADKDRDPDYEDSPYLSPGWQNKGDYCIEYSGIYLQTGGMMGSLHTTGYRKEDDEFVRIFRYDYADFSYDDDIDKPSSYTLTYTNNEGKEVVITHEVTDTEDYYEIDSIPEAKDLEAEFGFDFKDMILLEKGRGDVIEDGGEDESSSKNVMAIKAPGYTGLTNLKNENNDDGTYYYEDMTEDGDTIITNMCAPNSQRDGQAMDAYAENFVCAMVDNDAKITETVDDSDLSAKLTYPVYKISWESGENEDTRQAVGVVILTDNYTYYYGYKCPIDFFEDNEEFYNSELADIELIGP